MKNINTFPNILLHIPPIDFRKRRRGLAAYVESVMQQNLFASTLFIFINRKKDCLRTIYWDKTGFAMWEKELEVNKFPWPKNRDLSSVNISPEQAQWLLDGIDIWKLKPHKELHFSRVS